MDLPKKPGSREALIDYLLKPLIHEPPRRPTSIASLPDVAALHKAALDSARAEFEATSVVQLVELVAKKRQQEDEAMKAILAEQAKARAAKQDEEDRALFFNQPSAAADFRYWGKMACWSLDEAIALSLGKDPSLVNAAALFEERYVPAAQARSRFPGEYARRSEQAKRALSTRQLRDPVDPQAFLAWAQIVFESLPSELLVQANYTAPITEDLQRLTARIKELESELSSQAEAAKHQWPWGVHETELLRKLAAAASKFWVRYDPQDATTRTDQRSGRGLAGDTGRVEKYCQSDGDDSSRRRHCTWSA